MVCRVHLVVWVHSGAPCVWFILVRSVHSCAPCGSSYSFLFVGFIRARFGCCLVVGIIRVCWVHSGALLGSSGSFGYVGFIQARPVVRRGHLGWLGSFGRALCVILVLLRTFGRSLWVIVFIRVRWVYLGAPWVSSCTYGYLWFIRALPGVVVYIRVLWVHSGATGRSFGFVGFVPARPGGRRVYSRSLGSFRLALRVVGFIRFVGFSRARRECHLVSLDVLGRALGVLGFIRARRGGGRVHSGRLDSFWRAMGVVGFIWVRWVHSGTPWGSSGYFGFIEYIRERLWGRRVHCG